MEHWKPVKGYEGLYEVSDLGRVKTVPKKRKNGTGFYMQKEIIMSQQLKSNGYMGVGLVKDGKHKNALVHRIVAEAFLSNPNNYDQINHIDCDKRNNKVENLEWCDMEHNLNHARCNGLLSRGSKSAFCRKTNHLVTHEGATKTVTEWANDFNIDRSTLYSRLARGWDINKALTKCVRVKGEKYE